MHCYLPDLPSYAKVVSSLREQNSTALDVGCGLAHESRRLAFDVGKGGEVDMENWIATDYDSGLWDLGKHLFRESEGGFKFPGNFVPSDLLDKDADLWKTGPFDVLIAMQILHLFSWKQNLDILDRLVRRSSKPGTVIMGMQQARTTAEEQPRPWGTMYFHNEASFKAMWSEVGSLTNTTWKVEARLVPLEKLVFPQDFIDFVGPEARGMLFEVTRLA